MPNSLPKIRSRTGRSFSNRRRAFDVLPLDFIFHVGFTGHRDLEKANDDNHDALRGVALECELAAQLDRVFEDIRQIVTTKTWGKLYTDKPPVAKFISCLAEGSDRIAVKCAKNAGFPLICCLPFDRNTYENDFCAQHSKEEYRELLARCDTVFEINTEKEPSAKAYGYAGQVMIDHSDLLITIWNGDDPELIGGTAHIVEYARHANATIVWIHSSGTKPVKIIHEEGEHDYSRETIRKRISYKVLCAATDGNSSNKIAIAAMSDYLNETELSRDNWLFYRRFLSLLSPRKYKQNLSTEVPDFFKSAETSLYNGLSRQKGHCVLDEKQNTICTQFGWADSLAILYSDRFRTGVALRHIFNLMVTVSLCFGFYWGLRSGSWHGDPLDPAGFSWVPVAGDNLGNLLGFLVQAFFLGAIIVLTHLNSSLKWHQKFMDYRILAEMIRATRYLYPIGIAINGVEVPAYHRQSSTWTNLQLRSLVRNLGIPNGELDRAGIVKSLREICGLVKSQGAYHETSFNRYDSSARILGKLWQVVFLMGILCILLRVGIHFAVKYHWFESVGYYFNEQIHIIFIKIDRWSGPLKKIFNFLALFVPALGAFFYALLTHLGFEKLRDRSAGMKSHLKEAESRLQRLIQEIDSGKTIPFDRIREIVLHSCRIILKEVADWRVFVSSKPITKS